MKIVTGDKQGRHKAMTIIEITLVLAILVSLAALSLVAVGGMDKWKKGKAAAESLRQVYLAQKTFMADHPTNSVAALTDADLIPYLPSGATTIPTVEKLDGSFVGIVLTVMPPVVVGPYDPSGSLEDSLWDVGKP